jgi:hypothetical protein
VITQAALALEEKIKQLAARGPISEAELWKATDSLEAAKSLTDDEKVLLVSIFAQIAKTQKTKFVDTFVVENPSPSSLQVLKEPRS